MNQNEMVDIAVRGDVMVVCFNTASISLASGMEGIGRTLHESITRIRPHKVIIDFTQVSFFSSLMLGLLVDVWRRLKDAGGKVVISGINPNLTRVFRITNFDKVFEFYPDTDTALKSLVPQTDTNG